MRGIAQYQKSRVQAASKQQVLVMLVRTAYRKLVEAEDLFDEPTEFAARMHHVRAIFMELNQALDYELAPDLCQNLNRLYVWIIRETMCIAGHPERLAPLQRVVANLLESWEAAVEAGT